MRYAFVLIVAMLLITTVLPYQQTTEKASANVVMYSTKKTPSTNNKPAPFYSTSITPLQLSAGKKAGYTQQQLDSLQNINLIRKKF